MNFGKVILGGVIALAAIQLVPYGRNHKNPAVTGTPNWDSPRTQELFDRACKDCHSNNTVWPWYSSIAPVSWLTQIDVNLGREAFNVSEWGRPTENEGEKAAGEVREGKMPMFIYLPAHPAAKLSVTEKDELVKGLVATFGDESVKGKGKGAEKRGADKDKDKD